MGDRPQVILIYCSEDGDKSINFLSEDQFLKDLNKGDYGENPTFAMPGEKIDLDCFGPGYILIKGNVVVPKPVNVVKKYEL